MMRQGFILKVALAVFQLLCLKLDAVEASRRESLTDRMRRMEFVREMERLEKETLRKKSQKSLQERLLKLAREIIPGSMDNNDEGRKLENYGNDDYLANYMYMNDESVDLAGFALKYVGCQNVHTWNDDLVTEGSNPLAMNRFVIFRLCKANDCSAYNKWGCNFNFGEYVIPMEDYLAIMAEYHFEQFGRFCKTCYRCMHLDYYSDDDDANAAAYNATDDASAAYENMGDDGAGCNLNDDGCTDDAYWADYRKYWGERRRLDDVDDDANANQGNGAKNYYYNNNGDGDDNYDYNSGNDDFYNNDVNQYPWYADQYGKCIFEDVCSNYRSVCRKYDPDATHYESYFTCSSFNMGGAMGYLGPHCRSDGRTIGIGIYKDQYCNEYVGDTVDITEATGMTFDDGELQNYYNKDCISCSAEESYSLITDDVLGSGQDLTYPLCSLAYQVSGKCDRYMSSSVTANQAYNNYQYQNQLANEGSVCNFIESLVERNYDERGEVVLRSAYFDSANWQHPGEYVKVVRQATNFQRLALGVSMIVFFSLFAYAVYLTKKLVYRKPWRPPRSVKSPYAGGADARSVSAVSEAGRLSRASSGIVQLRSMSGEGASIYNANASMANSQLV